MSNERDTKIIYSRTVESAAMVANTRRAMAITATLNRLTFNDADEIRALFSELIGKDVDESFLLIPPFYTAGGQEIRVGRNVFVNQNCTFYDLGGLDISGFTESPTLLTLYVDRLVAAGDVTRLADERIREQLRAHLGIHPQLAKSLPANIRQCLAEHAESA